MKRSRFGATIGTLLFVIALFALFFYRQWFIDEYNYLTYHPTDNIATLASRDKLTDTGKRYFYASRPQIDDRTGFTAACGSHEASTAVLGCYTNQRIYIFDVTDAELNGIEEVTAAHEMLHAAYDRLSPAKRESINKLLLAEAKLLENDPAFSKRIAVYSKLSSSEYVNELHSVIGTEVANPGSELSSYYATYFTDRQAVVSMHTKYESVFANLESAAADLAASLTRQAGVINADSASYNTQAGTLQSDIAAFNERASKRGGFTSQAQFDQARQVLVDRTSALDVFRQQIDQAIAAYNADVKKFNSMETHLTTLSNNVNSNLVAPPKV